MATLDPPILDAANRELLWDALRDGTIDAIASARLGLSVVWTEARRRGFDLADVARWMSGRTAHIVGLADRGEIRTGLRADFTAVDDDDAFVVLPSDRELGRSDSVYARSGHWPGWCAGRCAKAVSSTPGPAHRHGVDPAGPVNVARPPGTRFLSSPCPTAV